MGLEKWFDLQLHPETLDQSGIEARLADFPAMQGDPQGLLYYFPSNAVIRQAIDGKAPIPDRPALRAIYENEMARVEFRRQEKDRRKQQQASAIATITNPDSTNPPMPNPAMAQSMAETASAPGMDTTGDHAAGRTSIGPNPAPIAATNRQMNMTPTTDKPEPPAFDPALISEILALPVQSRLARLAVMKQPQFDAFRKPQAAQRTALLVVSTRLRRSLWPRLRTAAPYADELASQRLVRDIYSNAQLQK